MGWIQNMKNDKQIALEKLYEIIETVERLDSAVENVSYMVTEKLGNAGDKVLEKLFNSR